MSGCRDIIVAPPFCSLMQNVHISPKNKGVAWWPSTSSWKVLRVRDAFEKFLAIAKDILYLHKEWKISLIRLCTSMYFEESNGVLCVSDISAGIWGYMERACVNDCNIIQRLQKHVSSGLNWERNVRLEELRHGCHSLSSQGPEKNIASWAEGNVSLIPSMFVLIEHDRIHNLLITIRVFACEMSWIKYKFVLLKRPLKNNFITIHVSFIYLWRAVSAFSTQSAKADENTTQEQESAYKLINSCLNSLELFIECRNYTKKSTWFIFSLKYQPSCICSTQFWTADLNSRVVLF